MVEKTFDLDEMQDELAKLDELEQEMREKYRKVRATLNPEGLAKRSREQYEKNREVNIARANQWRIEHPEQVKKIRRTSYYKNREARLEEARKYREKKKAEKQKLTSSP